MLLTGRAAKVDEKNGFICVVSMLPSWVMILKLSKKCIFPNFVLNSAKDLNKAIYINASERSLYPLLENGVVCYAMT